MWRATPPRHRSRWRPDGRTRRNFLRAGSVGALVVNPVRVGIGSLTTSSTRVGGLADRFTTPRPGTVTGDELHGEYLRGLGLTYFSIVDFASDVTAHRLDVRKLSARPGVALLSWQPAPVSGMVRSGSLQIDVQQLGFSGVERHADPVPAARYRHIAGAFASGMEHAVFESTLGVESTSTVDLLRRALDNGVPVGVISDPTSQERVFGRLNAPTFVRDFIASSVANGYTAYIPLESSSINDWTGTGWMQLHPDGAFGFLLAGGIAGGSSTDVDHPALDSLYSVSKDTAVTALGTSTNVTVATGAKIASHVLTPIGVFQETYNSNTYIQEQGGDLGLAVATGVAAGATKAVYSIATDALAAAVLPEAGPAGAAAVAATGSYYADQATQAIREFAAECGIRGNCP